MRAEEGFGQDSLGLETHEKGKSLETEIAPVDKVAEKDKVLFSIVLGFCCSLALAPGGAWTGGVGSATETTVAVVVPVVVVTRTFGTPFVLTETSTSNPASRLVGVIRLVCRWR